MNLFVALIAGTLFGFGLAFSGMTDPANVIGFLNLGGQWNPSLAFVMLGGLAVTIPAFQLLIPKMEKPLQAKIFAEPNKVTIDLKLVLGACLFGIGWGLSGLCPGPVIAGIAYLDWDLILFATVMLLGMYSGTWLARFLPVSD
jgi:hypothetical protein